MNPVRSARENNDVMVDKNSSGVKKILIFSLAYFPKHVGGVEVSIKEITDRISDIEFHLLTHRFEAAQPREERIGNVVVHRVGSGSSYFRKALFIPRATLCTMRLHRIYNFDGAWAMMSYMTLPLILLRFFGVRLPYVLSLQEGDTFEHMFRRARVFPVYPLLKSGFKNAAVVQAISTYLAAWAPRMGYQGAVEVIPNGAGVAHFGREYPEAAVNEVKDRLGKKMGDIFLITTSRLVHKNAVDDVLRALPLLPGNVRFIVLGVGPDEEKLRKIASDLQIENRVEFVGHVRHADLPKYLKASDIFIRPSRSEGMGASFPEAMAAGLPVIATQEGGIADFLFDEKRNPDKPITGWAVDKDSPAQIAEAVKDIMEKPEKVRAVVATAKEMVREKYDWDIIAKAMRDRVFRRLGI